MTQEKTRLKFRVSAFDGVSAGGMPEPRWTEKWGVGLFDYEEFHVTDQLLKLPFQETPAKTVCVFSIAGGALAFRHLDADRRAEVNGVERKDAVVTVGDTIKIGDTLTIEVTLAPPKVSARSDAAGVGPALGAKGDSPRNDGEEGPTLTFAPSGLTEAAIPPAPVFDEASRSVEIHEPSLSFARPAPAPTPAKAEAVAVPRATGPLPGMIEEKVELADHPGRDGSLDDRVAAMAEANEDFPSIDEEGDGPSRGSFSDRIRAAFTRLLRRDALAVDESSARPWLPDAPADPGITKMTSAAYGRTEAPAPKPWIPDAVSPGSRMRGRAFVFLVAALGALMLAVGVFRIQNRVAALQEGRAPPAAEPMSEFAPSRGIPIELIEEKVRRMRAPARPSPR